MRSAPGGNRERGAGSVRTGAGAGLPHIRCSRNDDECYGVVAEERADIMGQVSYVTTRDYEPFAELMPNFTGCNYRVLEGSFVPTGRGPAIGGAVGAIVGGAIGGYLAGRAIGTPRVPS